jgi:single-strand DNA-binding protein
VNAVVLSGRIAADIRVRDVAGERHAMLLLAVNRPGGGREVDVIPVCAHGRPAEACARFLRRGMRVAVDGEIRRRARSEGAKGDVRLEVVAATVHFVGGAEAAPSTQEPEAGEETAVAS